MAAQARAQVSPPTTAAWTDRARVLDRLPLGHPGIARTVLARGTRIRAAALDAILGELAAEGLVAGTVIRTGAGGRPTQWIWRVAPEAE